MNAHKIIAGYKIFDYVFILSWFEETAFVTLQLSGKKLF
jgi:hypothetical protein